MPLLPIHLPEADLSVYTIPKNGGTTLWAWVYFVRTAGQLPPGNVYDETWLCDGPVMQRKLIVRRDPVDRFISGYRNFRDKRGLTLGFDQFFEQFSSLFRTDGNIRHHFAPQSCYYPDLPLNSFANVVDFECFAETKNLIVQSTGVALPGIHFQRAEFDDFEVQEWQAAAIAQIYQCDYDAGFGDPGAWRRNLPPEDETPVTAAW
jgi:hypothetical protein